MTYGISKSTLGGIIPLLLAAALLACRPPEPPELQLGTLLLPPKPVDAFSLVNQRGEAFGLENLKGHWTFAFFGYTHCPDVCPTSLGMLGRLMRILASSDEPGSLPRGLFVSVDPQRDSPAVLAQYVPYFHPDFIGVTGAPDDIQKLTRQLGILYIRTRGGGDADYLIDHSTALLLFDPDAHLHALFNAPHDPGVIADDFRLIRNYYEAVQ